MSNPKPVQFSGGSKLNNLYQELCKLNNKRHALIDDNPAFSFIMFEIKNLNPKDEPLAGYQDYSKRYAAIQLERKQKFTELMNEWINQVTQKDKPDFVVISIGSHHASGEQMIPEFVRTDMGRTKYALLNIDTMFDKNNPYLVGKNFSNLCIAYNIQPNSPEMALLGECINTFKNNNMQVILMSFCVPTFHQNLASILNEQYSSLSKNFSYVCGYFQDFPVVVIGQKLMDELKKGNVKDFNDFFQKFDPKIGLPSTRRTLLDSKVLPSVNDLSLSDLFPSMRKTNSP